MASITTAETATLCTRCGAPLLQDTGPCVACVPSEETLGIPERIGPFRIGSRLGQGPRGAVYRARHDGSDYDVALKVLLDIERVSPNCLRQARAVARMRHANVLSLRSIGRVRGVPFIASDLFNGRSLEEVIRLRGYLNPREALLITRATAAGLESALEDDILHRGVKTTNIFVSATGDVRVADFGHSPRSGTDDEIRSGMIAPERISDEAIDQRADIWSLGMVLFQMLTGGRPIEHFDRGRPRFAGHLADTGPALRALIQEMITIDLDKRTPTYQAVTRRIDDALAELDSRQSLEEAETHIASSTRVGVAGLAGLALLIGVGAISSSTSSAAISTWDPPAEIVSAARRGPLLTHQPPTYDAHFDYMLGSAEADASFVALRPQAEATRDGGRLLIGRGHSYSVVHDTPVGGDLDVAMSFVLEPDADVAVVLRTDDGRRVAAMFRTGTDRGVELLAGRPFETVSSAAIRLEPHRPYLVALRRERGRTHVSVNGDVILVADAPLSGAFRVGVAAPRGGAELRSLRWRAHDLFDA